MPDFNVLKGKLICFFFLFSHFYLSFYRSNIVREINPIPECSFKKDSTNNYDMTIFHDDLEIVLSRRQLKKMPSWTRSKFFIFFFIRHFILLVLESQFELAIINQIYFNKNPEDIFGSVQNPEVSFAYSMFPPNFV